MKSIIIVSALLLAALAIVGNIESVEPVTQVAEAHPHTTVKKASVTKVNKKVTWRDNPFKCDTSTQWIRADNFKCLNKPVAKKATTKKSKTVSKPSDTKEQWMTKAGIPKSDWWAVDYIVTRESGWNPCAYYPGKSDCNANLAGKNVACGLVQTLPCGKAGKNWTDPVAALKWQKQYVNNRYGGYSQAVSFWKANHWY